MMRTRLFKWKKGSARYQLFIVLGVVWLALFVWYGPEMGLLSVGEGLELRLQNVFTWLYSLCLIIFSYFCRADDFAVASRIGVIGTAVGTILSASSALPTTTMVATGALAVFSALFSLGIIYSFVYILAPEEKVITVIAMIAAGALLSLYTALGLPVIRGPIYYALSMALLAAIGFITIGLGHRAVDLTPKTGGRCFPSLGLLGALLVVGSVQLFNGIAVTVLQYQSVVESNSYPFFYAGQFLAAITAYLLLIKWRLKIMDVIYIYLFAILSGFVLTVGAKSVGLDAFELGAVFLGYAEMGTIFEWLMAASICNKYKQTWVLRAFLVAFAVGSGAVTVAGSFLVKQTATPFYVSVAAASLLLISGFLVFLPIINRVQSELTVDTAQDKKPTLVSDRVQPGLPEVISTAVKTPVNLLTRREQEIAQLLLAGYSSPRIAAMLEIKLNTVKAHNKNIYGKLGINSRPELFIKYADRI